MRVIRKRLQIWKMRLVNVSQILVGNKREFGKNEALKQEKMDTTKQNVSEMKNVCTTNSWANLIGGEIVSNPPIM